MDWLVKLFGGTDMALVGVALAALMFVTLMMFAVVIMADRTTKEIIGKIYIQQRTLMAFLLKEYEEKQGEALPVKDFRIEEMAPAAPAKVEPAKETTPTLSEKEIAVRKAFGERTKERHRLAKEAKAANGT